MKPDELCNPTQQDLHEKNDQCLGVALKLAQKALNYAPEPKVEAKN
jgi:hypothetical protein